MKKFGDIFSTISNIIPIDSYTRLYTPEDRENDEKKDKENIEKWENESTKTNLKIAMEKAQPDRGAPGIQYPNYISWVEHPGLKLQYVRNRVGIFHVKSRFCAERIARDFGYVLFNILKGISPGLRAIKITSDGDKDFRCERAVMYDSEIDYR